MKPWWTVPVVRHVLSDSSPCSAKTNLKQCRIILTPCPPPVLPYDPGTVLIGCPSLLACHWFLNIRAAVEVHSSLIDFFTRAQIIGHYGPVAYSIEPSNMLSPGKGCLPNSSGVLKNVLNTGEVLKTACNWLLNWLTPSLWKHLCSQTFRARVLKSVHPLCVMCKMSHVTQYIFFF